MEYPPLVLLHPFPCDSAFWGPLREALDPGVRVFCPEAPGFGAAPMRDGWTIAGWADQVADAIAAGPGAAVVCGLSMGGYAALALAARRPEVLRGLVLADTRAEADSDEARAGREAGIARIAADGDTAGFLAGLLPRLVAPAARPESRDLLAAVAARQPPAAVAGALRALAGRPDRTPDLAAVRVPTVVIVGDEDAVTPPAAARVIAGGIPGASLVTIPGAGHMSALEAPGAFAAALAPLVAPPGG